jgi:hypothetical protein
VSFACLEPLADVNMISTTKRKRRRLTENDILSENGLPRIMKEFPTFKARCIRSGGKGKEVCPSCLVLSCLSLPCFALSCLALSCLALPCLTLPCLTLPYLTLPYLTSSCLVLSCLVLSCLVIILSISIAFHFHRLLTL